MYAFWMFTFISAMAVMTTAATVPLELQRIVLAQAETKTDNFLGYRRAVLGFKEANPAFSGQASASQLSPYAYWGDTLENYYGNSISGGQVYVWRVPPYLPAEADFLIKKLGYSFTVGVKRSGTLWSQRGNYVRNTGIVLPATIPDGALVVVN